MKKNILIIGYFGYSDNQLDGQTIKTRDVRRLLELKMGSGRFKYFDTQSLSRDKFNYFKLLFFLLWSQQLLYLPGKSNLSGLSRLIALLIFFKGLEVYYLVVGGWLSKYLEEKPRLLPLLKKFKYIGVESNTLKSNLKCNFGLQNVGFFPNFRIHDFSPEISISDGKLNLVFMARIMLEKGIDSLFEAANIIDKKALNITISFYGPVAEKDKEFFFENISKFGCVYYKGVLDPAEINSEISHYDALVLLTKYEGEGFPGSILDAYISGIPVIVTNWKFLPEFVDEGKTGFVVNNANDFIDKVIRLSEDNELLLDMKKAALEKSSNYSAESAWEVLKPYLLGNTHVK